MRVQALGDVVGGAVGDHGVDELVATGAGEVGVGEAQPLPVAHIVRKGEVVVRVRHNLAGDRAGLAGVGGQHHLVLGQQQCLRPDDFAGLGGVFGGGVVRVRPGGAVCRQPQHTRPERGDHTSIGRYAVFVELVELVEVVDQRVVGLAVFLGVLRMAGPDAEYESAGMGGVDAVERFGDGFG